MHHQRTWLFRTTALGVCLYLVGLPVSLAQSPTTATVPAEPVCSECRIQLDRVLVVADSDSGSLGIDPIVARRRDGVVAIAGRGLQGVVIVDAAGRIQRTLGRIGDGPGEYRRITALKFDHADSLHVFDLANRRESVLAPDWRFVRSLPFPTVAYASTTALLQDGGLIVAAALSSRTASGLPLHRFTPSRRIAESFGTVSAELDPSDPRSALRSVFSAAGGQVVIAHFAQWIIEWWDMQGRLQQSLRSAPGWMQGSTTPIRNPRNPSDGLAPPSPFIVTITSWSSDTLLLLGNVADRRWRSPTLVPDRGMLVLQENQLPDEAYDSVLEIVSPTSRQVIARLRVDTHFNQFADARHLVRRTESADGAPAIEIWRVRLVSSAPQRRVR